MQLGMKLALNFVEPKKIKMDNSVVEKSILLYKEQVKHPMSPGVFLEAGKYQFCAGAMVAAVGLEKQYGSVSVSDFVSDLSEKPTRSTILFAFDKLGWDRNLGEHMIIENDSFSDEDRKNKVIDMWENMIN